MKSNFIRPERLIVNRRRSKLKESPAVSRMKVRARTVKTRSPSLSVQLGVCAVIIILIWIVFGQTLGHDFVNYDDKTYVYGNPLVSAGLSIHGLSRALVDTQTNNWHPLTLVSHMIDCQLYDLKAGGHHFTNVLLHTIAAVLLFFWLRNVTGRFWCSAFVTALFAIHPLRVESVAWIAERKDVLSAVFFFLTLGAYVRYTCARSIGRYLTMSILFACGLMSKPMLVTTPVVLLLLDYWPLKRIADGKSFRRMIVEKLPLFALSAAASIVALALQVHSPSSVGQLPFGWRLENALMTYVTYIWQMLWPVNLAVFYPHPDDRLALWQVVLAAAAAQSTLSPCRLALVFDHAPAGDRNRGGWTSRPCRSLCLFAAGWLVHRADLARGRHFSIVAIPKRNSRNRWNRHCHRLERVRLEANDLLAEQRNALDAHPGGYNRQRCRHDKSRHVTNGARPTGRCALLFSKCARDPFSQ